MKSQASHMPDIPDIAGCMQNGKARLRGKGEAPVSTFKRCFSCPPCFACWRGEEGSTLGRGSSLSSAGRFWQAGVTSPGDCQPSSPAPGTAGAQPQALVASVWPVGKIEAPDKSLQVPQCQPPRHTYSRHPP